MHRFRVLAFAGLIHAMPALAEEQVPGGPVYSGELTAERHATTNALDNPTALSDWYTLLRGSAAATAGDARTRAALTADFRATHYDTYHIEDDRSAGLSLTLDHAPADGIELRGSIAWGAVSEGDEIEIGDLLIGTRTPTHVLRAGAQAGFNLGGGRALVLEVADTLTLPGKTAFEDGVIPAFRLEPGRNRLALAARLNRTTGPLFRGVAAEAVVASAEALGDPPAAYSFSMLTLKGEARHETEKRAAIGAAFGVQALREADGLVSELRPTFALVVKMPIASRLELAAALRGGFETGDSDDPLGSHLRRAELEGKLALTRRTAFGAGIYGEIRDNLVLGNAERGRGAYLQLAYEATDAVALLFRIDLRERLESVFERRIRVADAFVGVRFGM